MRFPLEEKYRYHSFHSPALNDADFGAKPLVMLVGQYSTGKTSFIRYLLGQVSHHPSFSKSHPSGFSRTWHREVSNDEKVHRSRSRWRQSRDIWSGPTQRPNDPVPNPATVRDCVCKHVPALDHEFWSAQASLLPWHLLVTWSKTKYKYKDKNKYKDKYKNKI